MTDDFLQPQSQEEFVALYVEHQVAIRSFVRTPLPDPVGQRGRMDITLSEHGMSLGRCPSLYSFCGDDLLFIVYPESGWKRDLPEADRQPPSALQSDGDRNMWILRRSRRP